MATQIKPDRLVDIRSDSFVTGCLFCLQNENVDNGRIRKTPAQQESKS